MRAIGCLGELAMMANWHDSDCHPGALKLYAEQGQSWLEGDSILHGLASVEPVSVDWARSAQSGHWHGGDSLHCE